MTSRFVVRQCLLMKIPLKQILEAFNGERYAKTSEIAEHLALPGNIGSQGKAIAKLMKAANVRPKTISRRGESFKGYDRMELEQVAQTKLPFVPPPPLELEL